VDRHIQNVKMLTQSFTGHGGAVCVAAVSGDAASLWVVQYKVSVKSQVALPCRHPARSYFVRNPFLFS